MAVFIYVYRYIINSRDRLSFDIFNFLVHLIQCKIIAQNPVNPLLTTKPYEVEMEVEEVLVMISHQVYYCML